MNGSETFLEAIKAGDQDKITQMLDQDSSLVNAQDKDGKSAVLLAAYYQQPEAARLLVSRGAKLDIFEAAAVGDYQQIAELLEKNPQKLNSFAADGFQPLGLAAFFGHVSVAELLLLKGAEVATPSRNSLSVSPLNSAAAGGHIVIARMLIENGADPNAAQAGGFTPLHSAAQNGNVELVRLLLERGADPSLRSDDGQTPLDLAVANGHSAVEAMLDQGYV